MDMRDDVEKKNSSISDDISFSLVDVVLVQELSVSIRLLVIDLAEDCWCISPRSAGGEWKGQQEISRCTHTHTEQD